MNKIVVIYKSKYGSTKQYAEWIAQDLNCDIFERSTLSIDKLQEYDTIIYGGSFYVGNIIGNSFIKKSFNEIKDKKIIVFTCGLADPNSDENIENIKKDIDSIFDEEIRNKIKFFHLRGKINYSNLKVIDRFMVAGLIKILKHKNPKLLTKDDKELLKTYGTNVNFVDKKTIEPIVSYVLSDNHPGNTGIEK